MDIVYRYENGEGRFFSGDVLFFINAGELPLRKVRNLLKREGYPAYKYILKVDRVILLLTNGHILVAPLNPKYTKIV